LRRTPSSNRAIITYVRNPANGYRTIPLPLGAHRGNEMSVRTA